MRSSSADMMADVLVGRCGIVVITRKEAESGTEREAGSQIARKVSKYRGERLNIATVKQR